MVDVVETQVFREPYDVGRRLAELGLNIKGLLRVREAALGASADATDFHPISAAGLFAWIQGTWALRNEFVNNGWELDTRDRVEAILNNSTRTKVIFTNVDIACNDDCPPKPRSEKGAGAERACSGNLFEFLPSYALPPGDDVATYYFMLDYEGRAELTRPVIKGKTFSAYLERIYLAEEENLDDGVYRPNQDDAAIDLDPTVARK